MHIDHRSSAFDCAVVLVGGGLANCMIGLRLAQLDPDIRIIMIEASAEICGNKTWSFHATDIAAKDYAFLRPLIASEWPGQKVLFPKFERQLSTPYATITAEQMRRAVHACPAIEIRENSQVEELGRDFVALADGLRLTAPCIIDGRGFEPSRSLKVRYQKFVGIELETRQPHGESVPTIMDARVAQLDGYRFFYVLPLSPTRLLVEDTRYSNSGHTDNADIRQAVLNYARERGWSVQEEVRQEAGVLPIALAQDFEAYWKTDENGPARVGMRAGLFQPVTGYSLPEAVRVADIVATQCGPLDTATVEKSVRTYAHARSRDQSFMRFLNRMLFMGAEPDQRYRILQRFYTLPQELIERFYAGQLESRDKVRILVGKPPIPIRNALRCVSESRVLSTD